MITHPRAHDAISVPLHPRVGGGKVANAALAFLALVLWARVRLAPHLEPHVPVPLIHGTEEGAESRTLWAIWYLRLDT